VGFVHVVFDDITDGQPRRRPAHHQDGRRTGIGTALLTRAAKADAERATGKSTYFSVLGQNTVAEQFYQTFGGTRIERP
jgi:GNAT superfamily N-acetyltransferase